MGRYSRQELLIGKRAQQMLQKSTVALVGIGALGTTAANLLARAGVNLALFDHDTVELHNLQRQTIFSEKDVGKSKALQAKQYLKNVNSAIHIEAYHMRITAKTVSLLRKYNLILDCSDTMETRFLLNDFCIKHKKSWIYSGAIGTRGMVYTYIPSKPCFRCLFSSALLLENCEKCHIIGILNTIPATIASIQVTEAIRLLTHQLFSSGLIAFDIMKQHFQTIHVKKNKNCICCQKKKFEFL